MRINIAGLLKKRRLKKLRTSEARKNDLKTLRALLQKEKVVVRGKRGLPMRFDLTIEERPKESAKEIKLRLKKQRLGK